MAWDKEERCKTITPEALTKLLAGIPAGHYLWPNGVDNLSINDANNVFVGWIDIRTEEIVWCADLELG